MSQKTPSLGESSIDDKIQDLQKRLSQVSIDEVEVVQRRNSLNINSTNQNKNWYVGRLSTK